MKKKAESTKLSKKEKESLKKGINKIYADSKIKAKQQVEKNKAPKDNWVTRIGK